jgi:hypothetical protein
MSYIKQENEGDRNDELKNGCEVKQAGYQQDPAKMTTNKLTQVCLRLSFHMSFYRGLPTLSRSDLTQQSRHYSCTNHCFLCSTLLSAGHSSEGFIKIDAYQLGDEAVLEKGNFYAYVYLLWLTLRPIATCSRCALLTKTKKSEAPRLEPK